VRNEHESSYLTSLSRHVVPSDVLRWAVSTVSEIRVSQCGNTSVEEFRSHEGRGSYFPENPIHSKWISDLGDGCSMRVFIFIPMSYYHLIHRFFLLSFELISVPMTYSKPTLSQHLIFHLYVYFLWQNIIRRISVFYIHARSYKIENHVLTFDFERHLWEWGPFVSHTLLSLRRVIKQAAKLWLSIFWESCSR
jgi:hypothetical protein